MSNVNLTKLVTYCRWANSEDRRLASENGSDYADGVSAGMSMAFDALADMLEGKIAIPSIPEPEMPTMELDYEDILFCEYLDEPLNDKDM